MTADLPRLGSRASRPPLRRPQAPRPHKGWTSRGYLPHFDASTLIQAITFRLADSLPKTIYQDLATTTSSETDFRRRIEAMIDGGRGSCALRNSEIAAIVQEALWHLDGERYRLMAWIIMPNHVHVMIEQIEGHPLADFVHAWKSFTAKEANKRLRRTGTFWAPDYFDRFIRDQAHFNATVHYIHDNPVKAGLIARAEDWRWSSAWVGNPRTTGVPPDL
jgi:REP element-mobilizing transposase RayT